MLRTFVLFAALTCAAAAQVSDLEEADGTLKYLSVPDPTAAPAAAPVASAQGDPHNIGAHGERFDMHGKDGALINMLSAKNASCNARIEEHDFNQFNMKIHGSFMVAMYFTLRTNVTGKLILIEYDPRVPPVMFDRTPLLPGAEARVEDVSIRLPNIDTLKVTTAAWQFLISAREIQYGVLKYTKYKAKQLDLTLSPLEDPLKHGIAPHGILGQTNDGDAMAVDGAQDNLRELSKHASKGPGGLLQVTPTAQAEGAIEGTIEDYYVHNVFQTAYKYSRFDATSAAVRDVTKLSGTKRQLTKMAAAGTSGDDVATA